MPRIVPDLATAKGFLRSSGAESDGLSVGLGIPIMQRTELRSVLLLLSSAATPIARVHEVWVEDPQQPGTLTRSQGVYGGLVDLANASRDLTFKVGSGDGLPARAWASGAAGAARRGRGDGRGGGETAGRGARRGPELCVGLADRRGRPGARRSSF